MTTAFNRRTAYVPSFGENPDTIGLPPFIDYRLPATGRQRENALLSVCKRETGNAIEPALAAERETEDTELLRQSREIAKRLRSADWAPYRETNFEVYRLFVHSLNVIKTPQFRRCMIIPWVAKQVRAPMLSSVEEYLYNHPYARMWTITSGQRVGLGERGQTLRARIRKFHRRLNRLCRFIARLGLEMVFRSTELGGIETDESNRPVSGAGELSFDPVTGEPTFHVHAHCIIVSRIGYIQPARWESILRSVWSFWGHQWADNGRIESGREVVKYITKPGEMLRLKPIDLRALAEALYRLRMVAPLGSLRDLIRDKREKRERIDWEPTPEGRVPTRKPDWNRHGSKTEAERQLERLLRLQRDPENQPDFRIIARSAPAFAPGNWVKEPVVTVLCAGRLDTEAVLNHPLVKRLREATADEWAAGNLIKVHTCTSTGLGGDPPCPYPKPLTLVET